MASILAGVKQRLGIFYSDATKDAEVSGMIAGAKAFLVSGGWGPSELETDDKSSNASASPFQLVALTDRAGTGVGIRFGRHLSFFSSWS